ncbi:GGDEF domain-containing protein [Micromonospora sp. WMMD812]|uniref:GGDEF domain-containing protein n=1 Tax=Micromonospora sp. WMMD812 TaxID=3015152 RepID=UPI00248C3019|nr:GGDEF domain-containing protein [Micromonospora sp. WMMD812]WBB68439.1 GGDEF domain-containing protein [Micromonospora sp. WMMD812]
MSERRRRMALSAGLHVVSHGVAIGYCLMTFGEPNRVLMVAGFGCGMAAGLVGLRAARMVTTKASGYLISFTTLLVTLTVVAAGAYWDGGAASPTTLGFVTTAVFVASYTPHLRLMIGLEALTVGSYLAVAGVGQQTRPGHVFVYVAGMLVLTSVCATQARIMVRQRSQLRSLAARDPLTGALNRRGLAEFAEDLFQGCRRPAVSVLCLDLDDFKLVNDRLGHFAGDEMLRRTVAAAQSVLRPEDAIARSGGDEFVIVLTDADDSVARAVAGRIAAAVRQHTSASIGSATAPKDGCTLDDLMRVADQRLYRAKQTRQAAHPPRYGHDLVTGQPETA